MRKISPSYNKNNNIVHRIFINIRERGTFYGTLSANISATTRPLKTLILPLEKETLAAPNGVRHLAYLRVKFNGKDSNRCLPIVYRPEPLHFPLLYYRSLLRRQHTRTRLQKACFAAKRHRNEFSPKPSPLQSGEELT